ncbi:hypothetical protein HNO91_11915 [Pseudomonas corrugata]|uniref:Uncharacterized protein n=1 Tax=Pseudomonas corrugata TaxID=47879 RepID=A0A7Y6DHE4_9PSED|nr:hypothetical protein [Pseudomonas corrugata]NUT87133.1 hypothetical protein [Pseudomonas corrugata]
MSDAKKYHVGDSGLVEGEALGRITVYLAADYDRLIDVYLAAGDRAQALATRIHHLEQSERQAQQTATLALSTGARVALERDALQQRLTVQDQRVDDLGAALKFYADRDHYSTDDELNWDSCSGEPSNILWHESEPWFIEDGSIARAALAEPVPPAGGEPEVVARVVATGGPHDREDRVLCEQQAELPAIGTELVDRTHVTRLQAEVEEWRASNKANALAAGKLVEDLQVELTKARELLKEADSFMYIMTGHDSHARLVHQYGKEWWIPVNELRGKICTALSNQSAPVAVVSRDICPNCQGSTYGCATCIPDFTPGNGNRAQRRALKLYGFKVLEEPTLSPNEIKVVPAPTAEPTPTAYDGFDNGID